MHTTLMPWRSVALVVLCLFGSLVTADSNFFLPNYVNDTQQGDAGYLGFPLGPSGVNGGRSQHFFSEEFIDAALNAQYITAIGFRLRGYTGSTAASLTSVIVKVAFPAAGPGSYSFSENYLNGVATTVFSGPWSFSAARCTGPDSVLCPFALIVNLTTPFRYESGKGGLLIDIYASTTTELTFDYVSACAGCKYIYSTLGNTDSGTGFGASAAATTKLFTSSELPPVAPPVAAPVAAPSDAPIAAPVESPVAAPQSQAEAPVSAPESTPTSAPVASTAPVASSTPQVTPVSTAAPNAVPISAPKAASQPVVRAPSGGASSLSPIGAFAVVAALLIVSLLM